MEDRTIQQSWEDLANAVILQAREDYLKVCNQLQRKPYDRKTEKERRSLETFFRSRWFATLSAIDGGELLKIMKNQRRSIWKTNMYCTATAAN